MAASGMVGAAEEDSESWRKSAPMSRISDSWKGMLKSKVKAWRADVVVDRGRRNEVRWSLDCIVPGRKESNCVL